MAQSTTFLKTSHIIIIGFSLRCIAAVAAAVHSSSSFSFSFECNCSASAAGGSLMVNVHHQSLERHSLGPHRGGTYSLSLSDVLYREKEMRIRNCSGENEIVFSAFTRSL